MEATAQNGGLIGLAGSVRKHASSAASFVSNPDRLAIYLVFFAGVITIGKKAGLEIPEYMTWFGLALGLAALLYEMSASRAMMRAFWEGRAFSMTCNALIWAVAFGFSVNNSGLSEAGCARAAAWRAFCFASYSARVLARASARRALASSSA